MIDHARKRKEREDRQGYVIIGALALFVIAVGGSIYAFAPTTRPLDPVTGCPSDGKPPASITVVLLDTTDPLHAVQRTNVTNKLKPVLDNAQQYAEIQLFAIAPSSSSLLRPVVTACNPGNGQRLSIFWASPREIKKVKDRWQQNFVDRLNNELNALLNGSSADTSPILESIQNVSASVFDAPAYKDIPKQLIIVSDMVQNTPGFSQYKRSETFDQFKQTPYYMTTRSTLDGVNVYILYLRRADVLRIQTRQHIEFWRDYFADAGAALTKVDSIEG